VHRDHDHRGARPLFLDPLGGLEAVHVRHPDVHQDDVGQIAARGFDGLATGPRFADDLDAVGVEQHRSDALSDQLVVVDQQDTCGHGLIVRSTDDGAHRGHSKALNTARAR